MRGKDKLSGLERTLHRITPAYAGKSCCCDPASRNVQDHPRLCGEKLLLYFFWIKIKGSPPPMRGKDRGIQCFCFGIGITPAYAGKSANSEPITLDVEDHPRLCGEKLKAAISTMMGQGSPPPMRGKGESKGHRQPKTRITPAYAGKSSSVASLTFPSRDHPRLCGEKPLFGIIEV